MLFGNELNLAVRKLRLEKLMSDEMKHEIEEFHPDVNKLPEAAPEHTILIDPDHKS